MPDETTIEGAIRHQMYGQNPEKTYVDKLLDRKDVEKLEQLMMKEDLTREDLLKLLYMLSGIEIKLANLSEWDRYILGKYFTWIREFVKISEFLFDYMEKLDKEQFPKDGQVMQTLEEVKKMQLHDVKFSVDVFLYIARSTLSIKGAAFDSLSTNRFDYQYNTPPQAVQPAQPQKKGWFR